MDFERLVNKHKEGLVELSLLGFNLGVTEGRNLERKRVVAEIEAQICWEFTQDQSCEHSSCWVLDSTLKLIQENLK